MPFAQGLQVGRDIKGDIAVGWGWLAGQLHSGLLGGSACLVAVAGNAGADHVLPGMLTPLVAWNNMVYGKLSVFLAAVLAGMAVTVKDPEARQPSLGSGTPNHVGQFDYRGYRENIIG